MKWTTEDIPSFVKERAYIDTALLPLLPVSFGNDIKQSAAMNEFISVMSAEIEKQFKGRMLLTPPFTYLSSGRMDELKSEVEKWIHHMKEEEMKHIILITADPAWKKVEQDLNELLVWMPLVPLENMDIEYKRQVVSEQIKQLIPLVMDKWKNNE